MINASKISFTSSRALPKTTNKKVGQNRSFIESDISHNNPENKITIKEGLCIYGKGMIKHIKSICKSIIKHPVKSMISVVATSIGLFALPLIGIPTVTAAAFMAIGFAGFSAVKSGKDLLGFIKDNKNHNYDDARTKLSNLGADTIDLAMSIPGIPKAVKNVSKFAKYGKISINSSMISDFKSASGFKSKVNVFKSANNELSRYINFQSEADKVLAGLNNCTNAEKELIKKHLLEFNVPDNKIPEVVLEKYAEITGIKAKPNLRFVQFENKSTLAMASRNTCTISIGTDDAKTIIPSGTGNGFNQQRFKLIKREINGNQYTNTYKDMKTGEMISEHVNKKIIDDYNLYINSTNSLSPQANLISTTLHERRHIYQYAKMAEKKGIKYLHATPEAEQIYADMIKNSTKIKPFSKESRLIESWTKGSKGRVGLIGTYLSYPIEIDARNFELIAHNNSEFQLLDKIYKALNNIAPQKILKAIIPSYIKTQIIAAEIK